jgi:hypothetical protein
MENDPVFVEIYSPRTGVWMWTVTFDDLGLCSNGRAEGFQLAVAEVNTAITAGYRKAHGDVVVSFPLIPPVPRPATLEALFAGAARISTPTDR